LGLFGTAGVFPILSSHDVCHELLLLLLLGVVVVVVVVIVIVVVVAPVSATMGGTGRVCGIRPVCGELDLWLGPATA
jgi:hypothetical protein